MISKKDWSGKNQTLRYSISTQQSEYRPNVRVISGLYSKAGINQRDGAQVREARLPNEFQTVRHFRDHSDDALAEITVVMIGIR